MFDSSNPGRRYAPVWSMLFATAAAIIKSAGTRYILQRQWKFSWSDVATAAGGAVLGYITFRAKHGKATSNPLTR